jgi:hypothetical protein
MSWFEFWIRMWTPKATPEVTQADLDIAYQLGFKNGMASGEYRGRAQLLQEIEITLAARGRTLADLEPEELQAQKIKVVH